VFELIVISTLNGVLFGMLLFLMASGLTVIFSMLGVLNFAHASFYMLGAFFGFQISRWLGFWPALLIAPLLAGAIGAGVERYGLRRVHRNGHVAELLFTFGLAYVIEELVHLGQEPGGFPRPGAAGFSGVYDLLHQLSRLQDVHAAGVDRDLRRPVGCAEEDADRPDRAGRIDPSAHGRPSRP
jgi:branched-subunit amino acid ABC-type transport system permease component